MTVMWKRCETSILRYFFVLAFLVAPAAGFAGDAAAAASPVSAVESFASALSPADRKKLFFDLGGGERFEHTWLPGTRRGVSLRELDEARRALLRDVLRAVLGPSGFEKVAGVLLSEAALARIENAPDYRNPRKYWLAVFGTPAQNRLWGLRFEGHHLTLNLTLEGNRVVSATPSFIGSNPARIPSGPHEGLRPLAREIDAAWALYKNLDSSRRKKAREGGGFFGGLKASAGAKTFDAGDPDGIPAAALTPTQRKLLWEIVAAYVETMPAAFAQDYLADIKKAEGDGLHFFWRGAERPGDSYLFRIQGKRLLIEHDAHDGAVHIHSIWRDKKRDFGLEP